MVAKIAAGKTGGSSNPGSFAVGLHKFSTLLEADMRHSMDVSLHTRAFDPVLSLDRLTARYSDDGVDALSFDFPDPSPGPDQQIEKAEAVTAVGAFLNSLAPRDREIVWRLFWEGETQTAVAGRFGVSKMAICKAMAKITKRGCRALAPYGYLALSN